MKRQKKTEWTKTCESCQKEYKTKFKYGYICKICKALKRTLKRIK